MPTNPALTASPRVTRPGTHLDPEVAGETLQAEYERICETPSGEAFHAKAARHARLFTLMVTHGCGSDAEAV